MKHLPVSASLAVLVTAFSLQHAFGQTPGVMTLPATIWSSTTATLYGQVKPEGLETTAWFEWGATTNYGSSTTMTNVGSGTNWVVLSFELTGLSPANTCHFRIAAMSGTRTNFGGDVPFTTPPVVPSVLTLPATVRSSSAATLNGRVRPKDLETTAWFEWGATTNYGNSTTATNLGNGTNALLLSFELTGLSSGSNYHCRMVAGNWTSTNRGADVAFTTMEVTTLSATILSSTAATLNGRVNPIGLETTAWFEWGLTTNYGSSTTVTDLGNGTNMVFLSFYLEGLSPSSTYHYRAVARNSTTTNYGVDVAFTAGTPITNCSEASLRAAVNTGGTVAFACDGTITLSSTLVVTNSVVLDGTGHSVTISGGNNVGVFLVTTGASLTLNHLTIANGRATNGAGIYNDGGRVNLFNCTFSHNSAVDDNQYRSIDVGGGGVYNRFGLLSISNTTFSFNTVGDTNNQYANGLGGALLNNTGTVLIEGSQFIGNTAQGSRANVGHLMVNGFPGLGGAIYNGGDLSVSRSTFLMNSAVGGAGADIPDPWADGYGHPGGDGAQARGGGIYQGSNTLTVLGCTFASNYVIGATGGAGGRNIVDMFGDGGPGGRGGNGGDGLGGGICAVSGYVFATNNSFASNQGRAGDADAGGWGHTVGGNGGNGGNAYGGALYVGGATVYCVNNSFGWNTANPGVAGNGGPGYHGTGTDGVNGTAREGGVAYISGSLALANDIIAYSSPINSSGLLTDSGHNISSDSSCNFTGPGSLNNVDPRILPLADNGGPTWTLALSLGSPAIDSGGYAGAPETDQRGFPRGSSIDIGAYEKNTQPFISDVAYRDGQGLWLRCNIPSGTITMVQVSTNLVNWVNYTNCQSGSGGWFELLDPQATNHPTRFYRLRWP